jgi:hypothetical protein
MAARGRTAWVRLAAGGLAAALMTLANSVPASAGIFERLFGGFRHAIEAPQSLPDDVRAFADPSDDMRAAPVPRAEAAPASAYCVRVSDGFYFPVQAHAGVTVAATCRTLCPATETRLYSGSGIDHAVADDGSRYSDLPAAFLYRKTLVAGSTCNGRGPFGLARVDARSDPTLRPGDIVATAQGMVAVSAMKNRRAEFTPAGSYRGLSKGYRDKLAETKIMPPNPGAPHIAIVEFPPPGAVRRDDRRSAELAR